MGRISFGKYELLKKVATGGMAELFLARQSGIEGFEKLLVLKRILPHLAESAEFLQMFLDEARLAARLNHPNVVQIYDLGRVQNQYFIAMEYVNGVDLAKILKRERKLRRHIPTEHAVKILSYVCEALTYAHDRKDTQGNPLHIVHRDISPQNVLVAFDGGLKLTDFGIAKASTTGVKTKSGTLKGKYYYMSPEQCLGHEVDRRSDIFSAGILLYQLLTSRLPFRGDSEFSVLHAIVHDAPRPPSAVRPDLPTGLYPILDRSLAKDPADRFGDALEMQMALEKFLLEEKLVSNTTLIGKYVHELFADVLEAQSRISPEDTASIEDMLAGLAIAQESDPGSQPTTGPAPAGGKDAQEAGDDEVLILTPSMVVEDAAVAPRRDERRRWGVPVLLAAVFGSAVGGALLANYLSRPEPAKSRPDPGTVPAVTDPGRTDRTGPGDLPGPSPAADAGTDRPADTTRFPDGTTGEAAADAGMSTAARRQPNPSDTTPRARRRRNRRKRRKKRQVARPRPAGEGFLTLDTKPWSEVWTGGKRLGLTPLAYKRLPAGRHKLMLRNPDKGIEKTIWIEIRPDQTTTRNIELK